MKIVIDTNVLVSALLFGGIPGRFVALWKNNRVAPLVSAEIMAEYLRVLAYPKFRLTGEEISHLLMHEILPWFETVATPEGARFVPADPADDKFIWCALAGGAEYICIFRRKPDTDSSRSRTPFRWEAGHHSGDPGHPLEE